MSDNQRFSAYFQLADEIDESLTAGADQSKPTEGREPLTLADFDASFVEEACDWADEHDMPWPPLLAAAEWAQSTGGAVPMPAEFRRFR